jgi:hypothetical protein
MDNLVDAAAIRRAIIEVRSLLGRQKDLIARFVAAGFTPSDIAATLKALKAQLELLEQERPKSH